MTRSPRIFLLAVLLAALAAAPAQAVPNSPKKAIWGPVTVDGKSQFPIYDDLGVGIYQYTVRWDVVAPTRPLDPSNPADPAYDWPGELDTAVSEAAKYGIQVQIMILGAPAWANGGRDWNWAPTDPKDFATFTEAAAAQFPAVHRWMIWSEPSKAQNFQPLEPDGGRPLRGKKALEGPRRYAEILDDSYAALKSVSKRNLIIGGNTFTVGTVAPLNYLAALKLPDGSLPRMDLYGHNAFSARSPKLSKPHLGPGLADFSDLDLLARKLDQHFKNAPLRKERRLKIFISEFSAPTDHANFEFNFFVSRATQAKWIRDALRITRNFKRIATFGYLGLYDDPVREAGDQVERGLLTREGQRKRSYAAYRAG